MGALNHKLDLDAENILTAKTMDTVWLLENLHHCAFILNEAVNFFIDRFEPLCWDITTLVILISITTYKWVTLYIVYNDTMIQTLIIM